MADSARIEDLRKRYHENPRRFFAPLANEYRKSGLLDRAILLCEKHLAEQPDNMNGLVVYGQTLFESGRNDEARAPFERALVLDPENLIALRHLGDIARLGGDVPTAKSWYDRLLEFDRRNDEVLELLEEMGVGQSKEPPPPPRASTMASALVSVAPTVSVSGGDAMDIGLVDLEPAAPAPTPAGPGRTKVVDAVRLAADDRAEAESLGAATLRLDEPLRMPTPVASQVTVEITPPAPPARRASLLDVSFDFSEIPEQPAAPAAIPAAPIMGSEAAEYGFADIAPVAEVHSAEAPTVDAPIIETAFEDFSLADSAGDSADASAVAFTEAPIAEPALVEPTAGESFVPTGLGEEVAGLELAEFSSDASPLAGLESTEFASGDVAPLEGLDGIAMDSEPAAQITAGLPLLGDTPVESQTPVEPPLTVADVPSLADTLPMAPWKPPVQDIEESSTEPSSVESPSARAGGPPRPRMTKADLASLPLLADFGLEDDPPAPAPAANAEPAPARPSQKTPTFVTETMATLYLQQGFRDKAIDVYRQLVEQSPDDAGLRAKLAELEQPVETPMDEAHEMPEFDDSVADVAEPTPAPANAMLSGMSFADVGLATPRASTATPIVAPAIAVPPAAAGPTAREFFAAFARRGLVAATAAAVAVSQDLNAAEPEPEPESVAPVFAAPTAIALEELPSRRASLTPSGWPLDALFGAATEVRDLHAADVLAGISTFAGPSGGTGLDALFSGAEPASAASAPSMATAPSAVSATATARRTVARASQMLKFDQFFSPQGATAPAADPVVAEPPVETPAAAPIEEPPVVPPASYAAPAEDADDDLDQFQDWLKGLKP